MADEHGHEGCWSSCWSGIKTFLIHSTPSIEPTSAPPPPVPVPVQSPPVQPTTCVSPSVMPEAPQDDPNMGLVCDECRNTLFSHDAWQTVLAAKEVPRLKGYSKGLCYTTTWEAIHAQADRCNWCRFLHRPRSKAKGELEVWVAYDEASDCTPAGDKKLAVYLRNYTMSAPDHFYVYTSRDDNAARFVAARERVRDVASPESYGMALQCLEHCVKNHTNCPKPTENTLLPDRVIDCINTRKPKLMLTGGQRGRYIALSYVWGASQPMMTTTKNYEKYCTEGLDMGQFPQTIQDAVTATYNLGERYLWIDAQCIIQDSDADKTRQLGMMHSIYRDSYLTINAACANAATEGFLDRERPMKVADAHIPFRCPDGTIGSVWLAKPMDSAIPDGSHSYWDEIEPISHRGWCLQERMLPPRSFVYAKDTLKYYCQTETANIGGALCEPSSGMRLPNTVYLSQDSPLSNTDRKTYRQAWLALVFLYTVRAISVPSDKLAAISALAEQFHMVYGDEYLAGLWRNTLVLGLLWKSEGVGTRPTKYRAPSWSWASVDGMVGCRYKELSPEMQCAEILLCEVTLKDQEVPFGEVKSGLLKLKAYMVEVTVDVANVRLKVDEGQEALSIGLGMFDTNEGRTQNLYVVPLIWNDSAASTDGIIVTEAGNNEFRRVAHFTNQYQQSKNIQWLHGLDPQIIVLV